MRIMTTRPLRLAPLALLGLALLTAAACGNKIGDSCSFGTDCASDGTRVCDMASHEGYCTIPGCDYGTCPSEAVCVRFYPLVNLTQDCADDSGCTPDEVCTHGKCALRSSESRYCMLSCGGQGDCRDAYECRDEARAALHGGEIVQNPNGSGPDDHGFCASALPCTTDADCDSGDSCDMSGRPPTCQPG